jgi:hypothetical protein
MANAEITEILSTCTSLDEGCFASDPNTLHTMLYMDDAVIRTDFQRVAGVSTGAGIEGIPLEEVTYNPATLEIIGTRTQRDLYGQPFSAIDAGIGTDPTPRPVLEAGDSDIDAARQRIAKCAYACGVSAVCPLRAE